MDCLSKAATASEGVIWGRPSAEGLTNEMTTRLRELPVSTEHLLYERDSLIDILSPVILLVL